MAAKNGKNNKNKLVVSDAHKQLGATIYERPHRKIGGKGGWNIDPVLVDHLVACFDKGASPETACNVVGLQLTVFNKWLALGNRLIEQSFERADVEYSDEEESYVYFARNVNHAQGMWKILNNIVVDETLRGNGDPATARIAMQVLARREPRAWESKNNVSVKEDRNEISSDEDPVHHTKIELTQMKDEKKEERDQLVRARRSEKN